MTPLASLLQQRIATTGPITVADFMTDCLMHPDHGYYATRDPFGASGDFTTAPEISQMFGELIGLWLAQTWLDRGRPTPFRLVELGPGRGTLMADVMRATKAVDGFHAAADIHLVETSPKLRAVQIDTIKQPVAHHDSLDHVPDGPLFLIANEFFDALPIRQIQRVGDIWRERVVGLKEGALAFGLSDPVPGPGQRLMDTKDGGIIETCTLAQSIAAAIGDRIAGHGGVALVIDYGNWRSFGDTLQAVKAHQPVDPLACPGEADLTAHVDFEALAKAASPALATPMTDQGVFLERLGITQRARALAQSLSGPALESHIAAHRRLTHGQEMGTLFKAMALYNAHTSTPPGFDPT